MGLVAAVGADKQTASVVQPGEGALDDPTVATKSGAVLGLAACDQRPGPALAHETAVLVVVVAAVGDDAVGTAPRPAGATANRRHTVEQLEQLRDVVAVAAGERPSERDAAAVYEEMLLAAAAAPVDRARTGLGAPFFAWTWLESAIARDHSISPAACSSASNNSCSRCHTPACCHS